MLLVNRKNTVIRYLAAVALLFCVSCGSNAPTASPSPIPGLPSIPSPAPAPASSPTPSPSPTPTPSTVSLIGVVTSAANGARISGATITILDGTNAGRVTTSNNGDYRFDNLTPANGNLSARATGFNESRAGVFINGTNTINFSLSPAPTPLFTRSGTGNTVFDLPSTVSRIRIQGRYTGFSSNFIVHVAGRGVVNELLGTAWGPTTYDGTHLVTAGGTVEIIESSQVSWTFTEVRQ